MRAHNVHQLGVSSGSKPKLIDSWQREPNTESSYAMADPVQAERVQSRILRHDLQRRPVRMLSAFGGIVSKLVSHVQSLLFC